MDGCFRIQKIPGKGLGVVALEDIAPGTRIVAEKPLITWCVAATANGQTDARELDSLLDALSTADRCAYFDLVDSRVPSTSEKTSLGIWSSNAFLLDVGDCFQPAGDDVTVAAVFRTISRFNHSCHPNAYVAWNPTLKVQTVHALRPISRDEEICVAYLGGAGWDATRMSRRAELHRKYHFECGCDTCILDGVRRILWLDCPSRPG